MDHRVVLRPCQVVVVLLCRHAQVKVLVQIDRERLKRRYRDEQPQLHLLAVHEVGVRDVLLEDGVTLQLPWGLGQRIVCGVDGRIAVRANLAHPVGGLRRLRRQIVPRITLGVPHAVDPFAPGSHSGKHGLVGLVLGELFLEVRGEPAAIVLVAEVVALGRDIVPRELAAQRHEVRAERGFDRQVGDTRHVVRLEQPVLARPRDAAAAHARLDLLALEREIVAPVDLRLRHLCALVLHLVPAEAIRHNSELLLLEGHQVLGVHDRRRKAQGAPLRQRVELPHRAVVRDLDLLLHFALVGS